MAEAAISSLLEMLGDVLIKEVKFLQGIEGKVSSLRDELERMQSFLIDANKKQYEDARVRHWISEMRELAQDAEDTIEMFLINAETARCITFPKCVNNLYSIGEEIDSIQEKLEAIKRSRDLYGIKDLGEAAASTQSSRVEWRRRQIDDHPVGLEDDVEKLLQGSILDEKKRGLSIAVVEGMGGIGKSTLAHKIYNHPLVVGEAFECRAWVVVSSEFTPQETIKQLILELGGSDKLKLRELEESSKDELYVQEKLQEMLRKQLEGKSYFIVLDDVWEVEHWEFLSSAFPDQQDQKCRILITTRNHGMAKCGQHVHRMKMLTPEKSWELLLKKAFIDGTCPQELESVGRQLLEKCNGLPLTIRVVGGLLVGKHSKSEWEQVLYQINSHLGSVDDNVSAILELSYQNLSPQLKSCFLCLAFFKEDATISAKRLINIWVGQGLIRQVQGGTMEEIGGRYLDELINRNIVQINKLSFDDRVKNCQLHDLIREVCLKKAKEEIGFAVVNTSSTSIESSSKKVRSCVVVEKISGSFSLEHNKHLRSLFLEDLDRRSSHEFRYLKSLQLLKILDIDVFTMEKLPRYLAAQIGLKYLRINTYFESIYRLVQQLVNPIELGVPRFSQMTKIPRWFDRLKKIEVIDFGDSKVQFPNVRLKMESLRYLKGDIQKGLIGIENWKNIETLRDISVDDWMKCSSKLMTTYSVRELGIRLHQVKDSDELSRIRESLEKVENLATLRLLFFVGSSVDASLCIPLLGTRLTKLKLIGAMMACPSASNFPPNLSHLTLNSTELSEDPMPELGKLPNLSYLKLRSSSYKGEMMKVLHDGFPRLKVLTLIDMSRLRGIEIEEGGMSHLKHLRIRDCPNLKTQNLPKLISVPPSFNPLLASVIHSYFNHFKK